MTRNDVITMLLSKTMEKSGPPQNQTNIYIYIYKEQSNESEISPIKPTGVTRIQAWIRMVFRNNDCVEVKSSKSIADGKNTN